MKNYLLLFLLFCSTQAFSQESTIDLNKLIDETQISGDDQGQMKLVWWIPLEFWQSVFESDPSITKSQANEIIKILSEYSMFAVVDGIIGPLGGVTYTPYDSINNNILVHGDGEKYKPIPFDDLTPDTQIMMSSFKPVLKNMLGSMGENMHFFVFPDYNDKKERICDPREKGEVVLTVREDEYRWRTPLGSVLPPKQCPADNEVLSGAWEYCPWHGEKLVKASSK